MLDIEKLRKREEEYKKADKAYWEELKGWKKRAREIFQLYYELSREGKALDGDKITLHFSDDTVGITATDFEEDVMASYAISLEDFIADDYAYRLKAKYQQKKQLEEKKKQKEIEDAERAELERLRKKYGE